MRFPVASWPSPDHMPSARSGQVPRVRQRRNARGVRIAGRAVPPKAGLPAGVGEGLVPSRGRPRAPPLRINPSLRGVRHDGRRGNLGFRAVRRRARCPPYLRSRLLRLRSQSRSFVLVYVLCALCVLCGFVPFAPLRHSARHQTTSIVDGGFGAMLYVTLTTPGTSRIISPEIFSRTSNESGVGVAVRASTLSQQRTSICWP
jgi:hypothetical protein